MCKCVFCHLLLHFALSALAHGPAKHENVRNTPLLCTNPRKPPVLAESLKHQCVVYECFYCMKRTLLPNKVSLSLSMLAGCRSNLHACICVRKFAIKKNCMRESGKHRPQEVKLSLSLPAPPPPHTPLFLSFSLSLPPSIARACALTTQMAQDK